MFKPSSKFQPFRFDVNPKDYHALKTGARGNPDYVMSRSALIEFAKCPNKWRIGVEKKQTDAMNFGSLVDCLVLDPARFVSDYIIQPDTYIPEGKNLTPKKWSNNATVCRDWNEQQKTAGKNVIDLEMMEQARKCANRLHSNERIAEIIAKSHKQAMVCVDWHDDETGLVIPFIALIDLLPDPKATSKINPDLPRVIYDLKTARDASYTAWSKAVFNDKLYYQAGCYQQAVNAATGMKYKMFGHVIAENTAPYEPTSRLLSEEYLTSGVLAFEHDMRWYCRCLKKQWFDGYDTKWVDPEPWMIDKL